MTCTTLNGTQGLVDATTTRTLNWPQGKYSESGVCCQECEAGMHQECYFSYHQLRYGVYLDNRYEVNKSRGKQGMRTQNLRQEANFPWNAVQPDIHSSDEEGEPWFSGKSRAWKLGSNREGS